MLKSRAVVPDFEDFRNKSGFIVKELATDTENFIDIVPFLPPIHTERSLQVIKNFTSWFLNSCTVFSGKPENVFTVICNKSLTALFFNLHNWYFTPSPKENKYSRGTISAKRKKIKDIVLFKN